MGSSEGPQRQSDIRRAIESLERKGRAAKLDTLEQIELTQVQENYKQDLMKAAAVVSGKVQATADGDILLPEAAASEQEKERAKFVHSLTLAASSLVNAAWLFYFGDDAPEELKLMVGILIQSAPWAGVFLYLNRKTPLK